VLGLPVESISTTADFFSLGGYSLLINSLVLKINEAFSLNVSIMLMAKFSTVKQQSALIQNELLMLKNELIKDEQQYELQEW
jgi:acyl carrier protein